MAGSLDKADRLIIEANGGPTAYIRDKIETDLKPIDAQIAEQQAKVDRARRRRDELGR